jgi:hypothetical protein
MAFADMKESGDLVVFSSVVVKASMTFQGSTFMVAGSTFVVQSGRVGVRTINPVADLEVVGGMKVSSLTLTANGSNIFGLTSSSGIHVLRGVVKFENGSFITWPDGSTNVAGGTSNQSAWSRLSSEFSTTNTTWTTIPGSTITLTTSGRRQSLYYSCPVGPLTASIQVAFLVNGDLLDGTGYGSSHGGIGFSEANTATGQPVYSAGVVSHLTETSYSGPVSFAVVIRSISGISAATVNPGSIAACQFFAIEI